MSFEALRRSRPLLALGLVAVLGVPACSGSDDEQANDTAPTTTDEQTSEPASTDAPPPAANASDDTATTAAAPPPPPDEAVEPEDPSRPPESDEPPVDTATPVVTEDDLAVFLAAAERALEGTSTEGLVLDDPEIYIALAQSACARFGEGEGFDTVASEFLESLAVAGDTDDAVLVGAILGAATGTICPEHADEL